MIKIKHQEDGKRGTFTLLENQIPAGEMTYVWAGKNKFIPFFVFKSITGDTSA